MLALLGFVSAEVGLLVEGEQLIRTADVERVEKLHPIYASIIEDAISLTLLARELRVNNSHMVVRALLERVVNFCYLQFCDHAEFEKFVAYSRSKAVRRLDRLLERGPTKVSIRLDGVVDWSLHPELKAAYDQFTSPSGKEITRWTKVSLPDRAALVEAKVPCASLFLPLLTVYGDASEALHGTLYGSAFHLGTYDVGAVPHDQDSLNRTTFSNVSALALMAGGTIDTLIRVCADVSVPTFVELAKQSKDNFRGVSTAVGLLWPKKSTTKER